MTAARMIAFTVKVSTLDLTRQGSLSRKAVILKNIFVSFFLGFFCPEAKPSLVAGTFCHRWALLLRL